MLITLGNRTITIWAATLLATAIGIGTVTDTAAAPARGAPVGGAPSVTVRQQAAVTRYWTPARMRGALRDAWADGDTLGSGIRWLHGGAVTSAIGKVFFTLDRENYACSGATVGAGGRAVVLTAAHCAGNGPGDLATNWMFVPGYADNSAPYGAFSARRFYVPPQWGRQGGASSVGAERYDVAFVSVNGGRRLPRGLPAAFGGGSLNGQDTYVFGYPSDPPFRGRYPEFCAGPARQTVADTANGAASVACGMTAGDSGGPWITGFSPRAGTGTVVAVSTYKYSDGAPRLYGTLLGPTARGLYQAALADG